MQLPSSNGSASELAVKLARRRVMATKRPKRTPQKLMRWHPEPNEPGRHSAKDVIDVRGKSERNMHRRRRRAGQENPFYVPSEPGA